MRSGRQTCRCRHLRRPCPTWTAPLLRLGPWHVSSRHRRTHQRVRRRWHVEPRALVREALRAGAKAYRCQADWNSPARTGRIWGRPVVCRFPGRSNPTLAHAATNVGSLPTGRPIDVSKPGVLMQNSKSWLALTVVAVIGYASPSLAGTVIITTDKPIAKNEAPPPPPPPAKCGTPPAKPCPANPAPPPPPPSPAQ
jgi:hypothetical protein